MKMLWKRVAAIKHKSMFPYCTFTTKSIQQLKVYNSSQTCHSSMLMALSNWARRVSRWSCRVSGLVRFTVFGWPWCLMALFKWFLNWTRKHKTKLHCMLTTYQHESTVIQTMTTVWRSKAPKIPQAHAFCTCTCIVLTLSHSFRNSVRREYFKQNLKAEIRLRSVSITEDNEVYT